MHNHYYSFMALNLARERVAEAERERLAYAGHRGPSLATRIRRAVARAAVAVARAADHATLERNVSSS